MYLAASCLANLTILGNIYNHPFTDALPRIAPIIHKPSAAEIKTKERRQKTKIVKYITKEMAKNATISVLAEGESLSAYSRKRLLMSFEKLDTPTKQKKSHYPKEQNIQWDVDTAIESLKDFPEKETINWTATAKKHGATQSNAGQILKEAAIKRGIDVQKLEHKEENSFPRLRSRKATWW